MATVNDATRPTSAWVKLYAWLSGIVVAFLASYLAAVLTAVIPAPKDLLCKLSLGYCTPKVITFAAVDPARMADRAGVGQAVGTNQIGMLHNALEDDSRDRPNMVKYRITSDIKSPYNLRIFYAAGEERPVHLYVNDEEVAADALRPPTGGWDNQHRRWSPALKINLKQGENTLMVKRDHVFPHLSEFELTEWRGECTP